METPFAAADLFKDPVLRGDAILTPDTPSLIITGPYELAVGGFILIDRYLVSQLFGSWDAKSGPPVRFRVEFPLNPGSLHEPGL